MGWNGSGGTRTSIKSTPKTHNPFVVCGIVAGLVVVGLICLCFYFRDFFRDGENPIEKPMEKKEEKPNQKKTPPKTNQIKNALAAPKSTAQSQGGKNETKPATNKLDFASMTADEAARHGYYKSAERLAGMHKRIFKTTSEEVLAGLLCAKPGIMIPLIPLPKNFDEEIKASLLEPFVAITDEDDDYTRDRKQAMIDARKTLAEAIAKGDTPSRLTEELRGELRKIAEVRENVVSGYVELKQSGASQEEIWDYIEAGNKLLDRYDAQHLLTPLGLKKRIELERMQSEQQSSNR